MLVWVAVVPFQQPHFGSSYLETERTRMRDASISSHFTLLFIPVVRRPVSWRHNLPPAKCSYMSVGQWTRLGTCELLREMLIPRVSVGWRVLCSFYHRRGLCSSSSQTQKSSSSSQEFLLSRVKTAGLNWYSQLVLGLVKLPKGWAGWWAI